jgi:hypothetical protein
MLQSEAGYIDARPLTTISTKTLATHGRTIHWVIFDRDEGSSKPRHVGCAPESGSGMRKQQRLRDLDRSLRQAQPKVESIRVEMRAVRGLE